MSFLKGFETIIHLIFMDLSIFSAAALKYEIMLTLYKNKCQSKTGTFFRKYSWEIILYETIYIFFFPAGRKAIMVMLFKE